MRLQVRLFACVCVFASAWSKIPSPTCFLPRFFFLFWRLSFLTCITNEMAGLSASEQTLSSPRSSLLNNRDGPSVVPEQKEGGFVEMNVEVCQPTARGRFKVSFREESGFLLERSRGPPASCLKNLGARPSWRRCRSTAFQRSQRNPEVSTLWPPTSPRRPRAGRVMNAASLTVPHESGGGEEKKESPGGRLTTGSRYSSPPPIRCLFLTPPPPNFWDGFYWKCMSVNHQGNTNALCCEARPVGGSPTFFFFFLRGAWTHRGRSNCLNLLNSLTPQHALLPFAAICAEPSQQFNSILSRFEDQNVVPSRNAWPTWEEATTKNKSAGEIFNCAESYLLFKKEILFCCT